MPNLIKTSVRVDIDPAPYEDPMDLLMDAFFEAADRLITGEAKLTEHFFTVRFDDNGSEFTATLTATEKKG